MADEKVNVSAEESKTPEAPAPSGPGRSARAGTHRGARCSWWGLRRPPLMRSPLRRSSLLSLVWVRTFPRRPAR